MYGLRCIKFIMFPPGIKYKNKKSTLLVITNDDGDRPTDRTTNCGSVRARRQNIVSTYNNYNTVPI